MSVCSSVLFLVFFFGVSTPLLLPFISVASSRSSFTWSAASLSFFFFFLGAGGSQSGSSCSSSCCCCCFFSFLPSLVLFYFFLLFHFKTQNSKKFRNPKDFKFSSSTHCWLMLCFLSYYQQKRHLEIAVVNVHLLYHTTFLLAKYSKTTVIWVVFGIKVVWSYFHLLSYSVGATSVGSSACLADFYAGCSSWQHQNN